MANRPREFEDFLPGSSDRPLHYGGKAEMQSWSRLEEKLGEVQSMKTMNADKGVDLNATNEMRNKYALDNHLKPVIYHKQRFMYRSIKTDENGLLHIEYSRIKPKIIQPLNNDETIPLVNLSFDAGLTNEIKKLVRKGILRGTKSATSVNISDLNNYLASKRE